jgi:hypothetical protein
LPDKALVIEGKRFARGVALIHSRNGANKG